MNASKKWCKSRGILFYVAVTVLACASDSNVILVSSDEAAEISIDGMIRGFSEPGSSLRAELPVGLHLIEAKNQFGGLAQEYDVADQSSLRIVKFEFEELILESQRKQEEEIANARAQLRVDLTGAYGLKQTDDIKALYSLFGRELVLESWILQISSQLISLRYTFRPYTDSERGIYSNEEFELFGGDSLVAVLSRSSHSYRNGPSANMQIKLSRKEEGGFVLNDRWILTKQPREPKESTDLGPTAKRGAPKTRSP